MPGDVTTLTGEIARLLSVIDGADRHIERLTGYLNSAETRAAEQTARADAAERRVRELEECLRWFSSLIYSGGVSDEAEYRRMIERTNAALRRPSESHEEQWR